MNTPDNRHCGTCSHWTDRTHDQPLTGFCGRRKDLQTTPFYSCVFYKEMPYTPDAGEPSSSPCPACNNTRVISVLFPPDNEVGIAYKPGYTLPQGPQEAKIGQVICPMCIGPSQLTVPQLAALYDSAVQNVCQRSKENAQLKGRVYALIDDIRSLKRGRGRNRVRDWKTVERLVLR